MIPSLFRGFTDPDGKDWTKIFGKESDLFWEFAARARELHGVIEEDWDILFAMQHYGTPTRLLDWTEVLGVAVYFATLAVEVPQSIERDGTAREFSGTKIHPPCVWVLNPYILNDDPRWVTKGGEPDLMHPPNLGWDAKESTYYTYGDLLSEGQMDWGKPVAIYPRQRTARMHAQRAWFTIHGDDFVPMETIPGRKSYLKCVQLPFEAIPAARRFLDQAGINHYLLFADLENLSLHLMEKNGLITRAQAERRLQQRIDRRDLAPKTLPSLPSFWKQRQPASSKQRRMDRPLGSRRPKK